MSQPVFTTKSQTIHRVEYQEKEKSLEIEFRTGNVYRYHNVPPRLWKIFQLYIECEGSAGSFFNEYIKNQFTSEKIKEAWVKAQNTVWNIVYFYWQFVAVHLFLLRP